MTNMYKFELFKSKNESFKDYISADSEIEVKNYFINYLNKFGFNLDYIEELLKYVSIEKM